MYVVPSFISAAFVVCLVVLQSAIGAAAAETNRRGFYVGLDVGAAIPHDLESQRTNIGIPTNCDQWLDFATLSDGTVVPLPLDECESRALPGSPLRFKYFWQ